MPNGHRIVQSMDDWMRSTEKRLGHEERRPIVRRASDLLGPGFAPYAVHTVNWNSEETQFNGLFYSETGAENTPDNSMTWIGTVIATRDGRGVQEVWNFDGPEPLHYTRSWTTGNNPIPTWTAWTAVASGGAAEGHLHPPDAYIHVQDVAATTWSITHNLGFFPSVTVVDSAGTKVYGEEVTYTDTNSLTVTFGASFGGKAYLS